MKWMHQVFSRHKLLHFFGKGLQYTPFIIPLLLIGNLFTYSFIANNQNLSAFYQNEFSPSAMLACGYEFAQPVDENVSLQLFLQTKTNTLECKEINHKFLTPLTNFQLGERYLLIGTGLIWKVLGIGWGKLIPFFLILYSITLVATYYIFRLGMNRYIALLLSLALSVSSLQMYYVLQLRDYSVAPFLLWLVWIAGKLVTTPPNTKKLLLFCAIAGILLGIGLGFRMDLLVLIPFFIIVLWFFVKMERNSYLPKLSGMILFLVCFILASLPILQVIHGHGNIAHVIILGLADSFTTSLGLQQSETYSIIPAYRDLIPYTVINSFSQRLYGIEKLIPTASESYTHYGNLFLLNYFYTFPADFLIRVYASIIQIPLIFMHGYLHKIAVFFHLRNIVAVLPIIAIAIMGLYQVRIALFVLFSLIYLGAYPVLQFDPRHYFYLEFIGLWFIGFLGQQIITLIKNRYNSEFKQAIKLKIKSHWKMIVIAVTTGLAISYGFLMLARSIQTEHLIKLSNEYLHAKSQIIPPILNKDGDHFIIKLPTKEHRKQASYLDTTYLKITIKNNCLLNQISFKFHYLEEPPGFWEAPQYLIIPANRAGTYFIPIYNYHNGEGQSVIDEADIPSYWIDYIEYPIQDSYCVENISYVQELENNPFLLTLKLQTGWQNGRLYQFF